MNNLQKEQIVILRANGESYSKIADVLGISINTIKSFCRRNNLGGVASAGTKQEGDALCNQCGAPLKQIAGKKQKRFCSNKCRMAWWNSHPEKINRIAVRAFTLLWIQPNIEDIPFQRPCIIFLPISTMETAAFPMPVIIATTICGRLATN